MSDRGQDCWLSRVNQIQNLLNITTPRIYNKASGKHISSRLQSKFDRHWLDKVNEIKTRNSDNLNHNKLRTYCTFKASFTMEPYLSLVRNRNQRSFISRLAVGSHTLAVELGRRTRPATPLEQRVCVYCQSPPASAGTPSLPPGPSTQEAGHPPVDTEHHFLVKCSTFAVQRNCLYGKIKTLLPNFDLLTDEEKFVQLVCPVSAQAAKLFNKFIKMMFESRAKIDEGSNYQF